MRTANSLKNIYIGVLCQLIIALLGFISRKVFLDSLGVTYLGINGLLTNVISLLGLIEAGIGISIVYNLYKPLAENDNDKVIALIQLYRKAYMVIALVVLILSIGLYPFILKILSKDQSILFIVVIYSIFVLKNVNTYLFAYKFVIINADQKGYVLVRINLIFSIFIMIIKILVLLLTKSYILYLIMELLILIFQNIFNSKVIDRRYPFLKTRKKHILDPNTMNNIKNNVKALILHNIGEYCVYGIDNLLIAIYVNVFTVGIYSNYSMIIEQLTGIVAPILGGIGASIGNLIATEDNLKSYSVFKVTFLVNFWIYSICCIFLYNLMEPFINWWLGEGYLLDNVIFLAILINFYIRGLRISISIFKSKAGIFQQDKYVPIIEAVINLGLSVVLAKYLGLLGIFIGIIISTVVFPLWNQPRLVFKYLFGISVFQYFNKYAIYAFITIGTGYITSVICRYIFTGSSFESLIGRGIICVTIPNILFVIIFYKSAEFKYLLSTVVGLLNKIRRRVQNAES